VDITVGRTAVTIKEELTALVGVEYVVDTPEILTGYTRYYSLVKGD
jgi:hypothetical protein